MTRTLIFTDGFENNTYNSTAPKWDGDQFSGVANSTPFGSGTAWYVSGSGQQPYKTFPSSYSGIHVGLAYMRSLSTATTVFLNLQDTTTIHLTLGIDSSGAFILQRGTTTIATSTLTTTHSAWHHLEMRATIADSGGRFVLKVDGVTFIDFTGDTRNGGNASVNRITLRNSANAGRSSFDDLNVWSITDFTNDPWVGEVRIFSLSPNGAGNYTDWTPSAGSNYQNVDEAVSDGDTTYNSEDTASGKDSYAFADISGTGTVVAVMLWGTTRKDDVGTRVARFLHRESSTDSFSSNFNLSDTFALTNWVLENNPRTSSAWSISEINASEFGIEMVS